MWALPSTPEYLDWLHERRQLWAQEMVRMEAHENGQYREDYRRLSEHMIEVRQRADALKLAGPEQDLQLRRELIQKVAEVEQGLEFLLGETPQLAGP